MNEILLRWRRSCLVVGILGSIAVVIGAFVDVRQFLHSYLWAYWFWLGVGIGALQMLMLWHLTGGRWGFLSQRIFEAAARTLLPMFVFIIPLLAGVREIFGWATPEGARAVAFKHAYLNISFLFVRLALYFLVWGLLTWALTRWSRAEEQTSEKRYWNLRAALSGPGIVFCSIAATFAVVDWAMSLEPRWYSTVYPLIHICGQVLSGLAIVILTVLLLSNTRPISVFVNDRVLNDLGNLMLTFVILWAYTSFSQLLITWAGNLPSEIVWYEHRLRGGWQYLGLILILGHFAVPFAFLLSRETKRRKPVLAFVCVFILVARLFDEFWRIEPAFHRNTFYLHWLDIAAPVALGGLWLALFLWRLGSRPLLPANDPRVQEVMA